MTRQVAASYHYHQIEADKIDSFLPETKGISLEEIDVIFGSVSHREKGEDILEAKLHGRDESDANNKSGAIVNTVESTRNDRSWPE